MPVWPAGTARPGPRAWTGRTSPAAGTAGGRSGRSWPVSGAAGRRSEGASGGSRAAGGDGGLCAASCGSTARAGWQGWLLTVWPGLGQHGSRSPQVPRRVPPWEWYLRAGGRRLPAWSRRAPDPYPPRTGALRWGHSRAGRLAGPGIREVPRRRPAWRAAGRAVRHGPQDPRTAKAAGPAATGPAARRGLRPWTTASGDAVGLWLAARRPCCRAGRMVFAARPLRILAGSRGTGPGSRRAAPRIRGRCAVRPVRRHCPGRVITYRAYYQRPGAPAHPLLLRSRARAGDTGSAPGPAPWSPSRSRPAN
jgi:hypothetical protein